MPWKETDPVKERLRFITDWESGLYSMAELCELYGISRAAGYKWRCRFEEEGIDGLCERSRAPWRSPQRTPTWIEAGLLEARHSHPSWGPKKLLRLLARRHGRARWPAASTAGEILRRHGLVRGRRRRRPLEHPGRPQPPLAAPNELWTADFKGQFRLLDGALCYPLTVADQASRYVLACRALPSTRHEGVQPVFRDLFARYGLPRAIRTDNGVPFATTGLQRLSRLAVWWLELGIHPELIQPSHPEQNGRHERIHRTLEAAIGPAPSLRRQQRAFDAWRQEFNEE
jgi:transposase